MIKMFIHQQSLQIRYGPKKFPAYAVVLYPCGHFCDITYAGEKRTRCCECTPRHRGDEPLLCRICELIEE